MIVAEPSSVSFFDTLNEISHNVRLQLIADHDHAVSRFHPARPTSCTEEIGVRFRTLDIPRQDRRMS